MILQTLIETWWRDRRKRRALRCRIDEEWGGLFIGRRYCSTHDLRWDNGGPCPAAGLGPNCLCYKSTLAVCPTHCICWMSATDPCPKHGDLRSHATSLRLRLDTDRNDPARAALYAALQEFERAQKEVPLLDPAKTALRKEMRTTWGDYQDRLEQKKRAES